MDEMRANFSPDMATCFVGYTPEVERLTRYYRYNEVLLYLKNNRITEEKWIAVDDDPGHFPDSCVTTITESLTGFDANADKTLCGHFRDFGYQER